MGKVEVVPRFAPEHWVTLRDSGEHVKVEAWSRIAAAYRVRSRKRGVLFATDDELDDMLVHPDAEQGKYWTRCRAPGCGAPLTPGLVTCPRCQSPTCTCGRCHCVRLPSPSRGKSTRKKAAPQPR